jgi:asparagine synthase (glutamine-hydrolysing)
MCGLCGTVGIQNHSFAERLILRMSAALTHRGPDEHGELILPLGAPHVALGMRRLSIIDLPSGSQPIFNEKRDVAVVHNGEIYNFRELRAELTRLNHIFRTHSDTEVIVHGYEEWGTAVVRHLRGMFAIALLDMRGAPSTPATVFLARDRFGIKPLYYSLQNGTLVFASEVRALLASGLIPPDLSPAALESFLLFGSVAEPQTLVENVFSVPPGHFAVIRAAHPTEFSPEPYWTAADSASTPAQRETVTLASAAKQLRPELEDAVARHLIADVELGVFLSSGLDSTALVALASAVRAGLRTFTLIFEEQDFNEAALARETARHFGAHHDELLLRGADVLDRLDEALGALDQPTMDGINTYFVSWAARRVGLKVALSGLGGDEVFGGYSTFSAAQSAARVAAVGKKMPRVLRSLAAPAVGWAGAKKSDARRKISSLWSDGDFLPHPYFFTRLLFTPQQAADLRAGEWMSDEATPWRKWLAQSARSSAGLDSFTAVSVLEMRTYMAQTLLRDTDSVSMAHSLEVRVPLLDHVLAELVLQLPAAAKTRPNVNKALLVESLRDLLPEEILRQPKRTFTLPWEIWLRGPLASKIRDGLSNVTPALAARVDSQLFANIWADFGSGGTSWSRPWALFVLNEWCRRHLAISEDPVPESAATKSRSN